MVGQKRHAARALAQRRHVDAKHIKTIKKVLAKSLLSHGLFQVFVGCRNDANVGANVLLAADPAEGFRLQNSQETHLGFLVDGANLIEEIVPP